MTTTGGVDGGSDRSRETDGRDGAERSSGDAPEPESDRLAGAGPKCPFCGSTDTERESAFGSEVSAEQYYCNGCHTVFERIKFDGASADTGRGRSEE